MKIRNIINHAIMINFYDEPNKIIPELSAASLWRKEMERYWVSTDQL